MTPRIETIGDAQLYLGDCREILPTLGRVDAVVTDPPYGIAYSQNVNRRTRTTGLANNNVPARKSAGDIIVGDDAAFDPAFLLGCPRTIMWGANHYVEKLPKGTWLVWDKRCGAYPELDQADAEIAWCSVGSSVRVFRWLWAGLVKQRVEKARGGENASRPHPFEKPVELMEWCISRFKDNPETILDPFMGSGTTGVACMKLGRKFIGIEIEPKYFDIACRRIEEAWKQPRLFEEPKPKPEQLSLLSEGEAA